MSNPIVKRYCLLIEGVLVSPLLAGSGKDEVTDSDVMRDAFGRPYVSGSSLAGAFVHYLRQRYGGHERAIANLFGSQDGFKSRLLCYHMELGGEGAGQVISRRDGVKLDKYKAAVHKAKYMVETVDAGTPYRMRLEWVLRERNVSLGQNHESGPQGADDEMTELTMLCDLIDGMADGKLTFGAKGNRGFGKIRVDQVHIALFEHGSKEQSSSLSWLDWDWNSFQHVFPWRVNESNLIECPRSQRLQPVSEWHELRVQLAIRQTLMIRQYAVTSGTSDYEQLQHASGVAVIPGTSWAGALRRHITRLMQEIGLNEEEAKQRAELMFGAELDGSLPSMRKRLTSSLLRIEESFVKGGAPLPVSRTAIDRFTGGVKTGALFTTRPWVGGTTELVIRWNEPKTGASIPTDVVCGLLLWAVRDLQDGLLPIGGETAIGRGMLEASGAILIDDKPVDADEEREYSRQAVLWLSRGKVAFTNGR